MLYNIAAESKYKIRLRDSDEWKEGRIYKQTLNVNKRPEDIKPIYS